MLERGAACFYMCLLSPKSATRGQERRRLINQVAMASERVSEPCNRIGDTPGSLKYFERSKDLYEEYGAAAKVCPYGDLEAYAGT
jgi:hypothetical protein